MATKMVASASKILILRPFLSLSVASGDRPPGEHIFFSQLIYYVMM